MFRLQKRAFTIVELLVVVAIIFVLASLLLPVMSSMVRNARLSICEANEKQLSSALFLYAADNHGQMPLTWNCWPNNGSWGVADLNNGVIWRYLAPSAEARAKVIRCPSDSLEQLCTFGGTDIPEPPFRNFSYSLNLSINNLAGTEGVRVGSIVNPSHHAMIYEEFAPNDCTCYGPGDIDDWLTGRHGPVGSTEHRSTYNNANWKADGRGNVAFFDGHVGLMSVSTYFYDPFPAGLPPNSPNLISAAYHYGPLNR